MANGKPVTDVFRFGPTFIDIAWERPALDGYVRDVLTTSHPTYVSKKLNINGSYANGNGIERIREDLKRFAGGKYVLLNGTPATENELKNGIRVRDAVNYAAGDVVMIYSLNLAEDRGDIIIPGSYMERVKDDDRPPMEVARVHLIDSKGEKLIRRRIRDLGIRENPSFW